MATDADKLRSMVKEFKHHISLNIIPDNIFIQNFQEIIDKTQNQESCDEQPNEQEWTLARDLAVCTKKLKILSGF